MEPAQGDYCLLASQYKFDHPNNTDTNIATASDFIENRGSNKFCVVFGYTHFFPCFHVVSVSCLWITQPKMTD